MTFRHVLPPSRLGQQLASLEAFHSATNAANRTNTKEYSLVVVTDRQRILLGFKHRGFGKGMFNNFGGKKEANESIPECACRELQEETGITVPLPVMEQCRVGSLQFTFADQEGYLMLVHVFHVDMNNDVNMDSSTSIRGCEEITPQWMDSYWEIPLDNMFADDSLWLTQLLTAFSQGKRLLMDGWFHFLAGGQEVNSIRHYYMNVRPKETTTTTQSFSLEKRLFHALCYNRMHNTTVKEFKESWAFCNAVKKSLLKQSTKQLEVIMDVAGGHGALAALFLITTSASRAVIIDPAQVGGGAVEKAWRTDEFLRDKQLEYRQEDLRTGLPAELSRTLQSVDPERVLVVACHACQHLSEEILEIVCCQFPGVHAAVMPCCQKDLSPGCSWKNTSKNLKIPIEKVMDLLLAGKVMSWQIGSTSSYNYDVRMRVIDGKITPQNRIILCKAINKQESTGTGTNSISSREAAHQKLASTYARAHTNALKGSLYPFVIEDSKEEAERKGNMIRNYFGNLKSYHIGGICGIVGFAAGVWFGSRGRANSS